jgi:cytochrome c oxidase subunit 2
MSEHHDETRAEAVQAAEAHADAPHADAPHGETGGEEPALHVDRYEGIWMRLAVIILFVFFILIAVSAFSVGFQVPGVTERIDPTTLYEPGNPFAEPGLRELAPGKYEAYIRAQIWQFAPSELRIPAGSTVTFYVTSQDVQHGIKIQNTNVNMMAIPGQVTRLSHTFAEPGTYDYVCHEYCGQLHHTMWGQIIVEEPAAEQAQAQ